MNRRELMYLMALAPVAHVFGKLAPHAAPVEGITNLFKPGHLTIIAGRPGMGKTAAAVSLANFLAVERQRKVNYFTLDQIRAAIFFRMIATQSGIPRAYERAHKLSEPQMQKVVDAVMTHNKAGIRIHARFEHSARDIGRELRTRPADVVFVDYLQIMRGARRFETRHFEVADTLQTLRSLARERNLSVVVLSQVNRWVVDETEVRRPTLEDMHFSKTVEKAADSIVLLHRESYFYPHKTGNVLEAIVAKRPSGGLGTVRLGWNRGIVELRG